MDPLDIETVELYNTIADALNRLEELGEDPYVFDGRGGSDSLGIEGSTRSVTWDDDRENWKAAGR